MFRQSLYAICFLSTVLLSTVAFAQSRVVILKTTAGGVDESIVALFNQEVATAIGNPPDYTVSGRQEVTVADLALGAGCAEADQACLKQVGQMMDSDFIVFGSIENAPTEETSLFAKMTLFDFASGTTKATAERSFTPDEATTWLPVLAETLVWGNSGQLVVDAGDAEVFLDGESVGFGKQEIDELPLGAHLVEARIGEEQHVKEVVLRHGVPQNIVFEFASVETTEVASGPSVVPGVVLVVLGVAGIATGVVTSLGLKSDHDEIARIESEFGDPSCECFRRDTPESEIAKFKELEEGRGTKTVIQFIGYGAGAVLTGVGTYLIVRALGNQTTETDASADVVRLEVVPRKGGVTGQVTVRF